MSQPSWSGQRPANDAEAASRICIAALTCFERLGIGRTTMSDIAREAGITRPTLYRYFKNKRELLFAAIDRQALEFTQLVIAHAQSFQTIEERIVETIVFVIAEFPKARHLSLIFQDEMGQELRARAFSDQATLVFSQMTAKPLIELRPDLESAAVEITEIMSRFAISMILFPGRYSSDLDTLRQLIKRRILPGLL